MRLTGPPISPANFSPDNLTSPSPGSPGPNSADFRPDYVARLRRRPREANLYAAGGTMGGLQGGPRIGVAGGWSEATTFGLLAAEHAARRV